MGFIWIQNIAIDADIDSADIVEIRDAADFVLDNLCVVDNVGEDAGHDGLDLGAEDGADNNLEDGVENADHNPAENGVDDGAENGVDNADDNPAENGTDNLLEDSAALPTNNLDQADCGGDDHPHYAGALNFEDDTAQVDHADHNPAYAPLHVLLELAGDDSDHEVSV